MPLFRINWLDKKLDQKSQRNKKDSKPKKVECQSEYHIKKEVEIIDDEIEEKSKPKNTFRTRKVSSYYDCIFLICKSSSNFELHISICILSEESVSYCCFYRGSLLLTKIEFEPIQHRTKFSATLLL